MSASHDGRIFDSPVITSDDWDQVRELKKWAATSGRIVRATVLLHISHVLVVPMDTVFPVYELWIPRWAFDKLSRVARSFTMDINGHKGHVFKGCGMNWKARYEVEHAVIGSSGLAFLSPALTGREVARTPSAHGLIHARLHFSDTRVGCNAIIVSKVTKGGSHCHELTAVQLPKEGGEYDVVLGPKEVAVRHAESEWAATSPYAWPLDDDAMLQIGVHRFSCGVATVVGHE